MSNQIDSPRTLSLANLWQLAGGFHSVAKQAPFRIAFWIEFGSKNGPEIDEISSFGALRFASAFRAGKSLVSGSPGSWKTLVLLIRNKVFRKTKLLPTGTIFGWFSTPKLLWNPLKVASKCYPKTYDILRKSMTYESVGGNSTLHAFWLRFWNNFET